MKTKNAYLIMVGDFGHVGVTLSDKLRNYKGSQRAVRAAKRMGHKDAYAVKFGKVDASCRLKGEKLS